MRLTDDSFMSRLSLGGGISADRLYFAVRGKASSAKPRVAHLVEKDLWRSSSLLMVNSNRK